MLQFYVGERWYILRKNLKKFVIMFETIFFQAEADSHHQWDISESGVDLSVKLLSYIAKTINIALL